MYLITKLYGLCLLLIVGMLPGATNARNLLKSVPLNNPEWMTTDASGNVYVISGNNSLLKLNSNGDSINYYQTVDNGTLSWVDASNPLKLMLFFSDYMKIVFLDRMMGYTSELDIKQLNIFNTNAVGVSQDGNVWIYDYNNAVLKKADLSGNIIVTGNDMRMEAGTVPAPVGLMERDRKVYLIDTVQGIFVFDRYGGFLNQLPVTGEKDLQINGDQLIFFKGGQLFRYDLNTGAAAQATFDMPDEDLPIHAQLQNGRAYLLFPDRIDIYQL